MEGLRVWRGGPLVLLPSAGPAPGALHLPFPPNNPSTWMAQATQPHWISPSAQDLARVGSTLGVCPYYGSRQLVAEADLLLLPYSAVLSQETRCRAGQGGRTVYHLLYPPICVTPTGFRDAQGVVSAGKRLLQLA